MILFESLVTALLRTRVAFAGSRNTSLGLG